MNGATSFTTHRLRGAMLGDLVHSLMWPASLCAFLVWALVHGYRPEAVAQALGLVTWVAVAGLTLHRRHFSIEAKLVRAMTEVGLVYRRRDGTVERPRVRRPSKRNGQNVRLRVKLPPGITLRHVWERQEALEHRLDRGVTTWHMGGYLHVDLLGHRLPDRVEFADFYKSAAPVGGLMVGLGRGHRGDLWLDLAALPHLLIGGLTGMGKSVLLRQLVTRLVLAYQPAEMRLTCIDLKGGVELADFGALPHALMPVADTMELAAAALDKVRRALDMRLAALRETGTRDIDEWNAKVFPKWPRIVVVVDELAELTARETGEDKVAREAQKAARSRVSEVARLGRAVGIHLIVCTQRPDAEAVPGQIKANLPGTVAFHVRNAVNSMILLDSDRAAMLPPHPGRAIWQAERVEEFQAVHLGADECRRLLRANWRLPAQRRGTGPTGPVTQWDQSPNSGGPSPDDWESLFKDDPGSGA